MLDVIYYRDRNLLTVTGHARSDEYGKDLVCAAASALALTLCANVGQLDVMGYITHPVMKLERGSAEIGCRAKQQHREKVRQVFGCLCVGFEVLATQWPEHVSYSVCGW